MRSEPGDAQRLLREAQRPKPVSTVTRFWDPDFKGETFTGLRLGFENDVVATMVSSGHATTLPGCRLCEDGTKGSAFSTKTQIHVDSANVIIRSLDGELSEQTYYQEEAFVHAMGRRMKHLVDAIKNDTEPPHSGSDNLGTMEIVDGAYFFAEKRESVSEDELRIGAGVGT